MIFVFSGLVNNFVIELILQNYMIYFSRINHFTVTFVFNMGSSTLPYPCGLIKAVLKQIFEISTFNYDLCVTFQIHTCLHESCPINKKITMLTTCGAPSRGFYYHIPGFDRTNSTLGCYIYYFPVR